MAIPVGGTGVPARGTTPRVGRMVYLSYSATFTTPGRSNAFARVGRMVYLSYSASTYEEGLSEFG